MLDLSGPSVTGAHSLAVRPAPQIPVPAVPKTEDSQASGTSTDAKRDERANKRPEIEPHAGPSPAFQASLLELENNLEAVIKRVEAARERTRNEQAISPSRAGETQNTNPYEHGVTPPDH